LEKVEAEPLYLRALAIREQQLGSEHPDTAFSLHDLAHLYARQGKFAEAESLYQRALAIRVQQLGPEHPDTQNTQERYEGLLQQKATLKVEAYSLLNAIVFDLGYNPISPQEDSIDEDLVPLSSIL